MIYRHTLTALPILMSALLGCSDDAASTTPQGDTVAAADDGSDAASDSTDASDASDSSDGSDASDAADGDDGADGDDEGGPDATDGSSDVIEGDDTSTPPPTCSTGSSTTLSACAETERLEADVKTMAGPRVSGTADHAAVMELCATRFAELGYTVEKFDYGPGTNVIGKKLGTSQPDHQVLIGAHYDGQYGCNGADDNASGVAGVLEVARLLSLESHARTVTVACWDEEELGLLGSQRWVRRAVTNGERVVVNFNFEMIGYYKDEPGSQTLPAGFDILFAAAAKKIADGGNRGDFIALVADAASAPHVTAIEGYASALGMPTVPAVIPDTFIDLSQIGQLRRSDHAGFWDERLPAIMITDTAEFRNPNYHCGSGPDDPSSLDYVRMAQVVGATAGAARDALAEGDASEGKTGLPVTCTLGGSECGDGKKCTVAINDVSKWRDACVDVLPAKVQKGGTCTRPTGTVGQDDCDTGLFCAFWGVKQSDPQVRQCLEFCTTDEQCDEGERCADPNPSSTRMGLCMKSCDPFGQECGEGLSCRYWKIAWTDGAPLTVCHWTGSLPEGSACSYDLADDCADGLSCIVATTDGSTACRAPCDETHPCPEGRSCLPDRNQGPGSAYGFCQP